MLSSFFVLVSLLGTQPERPSYLFQVQAGPNQKLHLQGAPYRPRPGDILLFNDHSTLTQRIYHCCGTGGPLHVGIVFRKADGSLAVLEAGTNAVMRVFIFDLDERLHNFYGTILVRTLKRPLSDEQSKQLAEFCFAQEGKPYAIGRLILQGTPFRPRSSFLADYFGRTVIDRDRWICSELVVAAAVVAEVWPLDAFPANMMYPRDLCYDERFDLSPYYEPAAMWYPRAELEYGERGVRIIDPKTP